MSIIIFPKLDKKIYTLLAFILISCLSYITNLLIGGIQPFMSKFFDHICIFLIVIPYLIYKIIKNKVSNKHKKKILIRTIKTSSTFTKKDFFVFIIIGFIDLCANLSFIVFDIEFKKTFYFYNRETIQMILVLIFSRNFSNSIYYKHKLISQFIFTFLTTILDIIIIIKKKDIFEFNYINILSYFITILFDAISITYKHYLFEVKYFSVENLMFSFGIFNCFFMSIIYISEVIYGQLFCLRKNQCLYIINFKYDNLRSWINIIISFLINSFSFIFYYKTLKNFTPNDILLTVSIYIYFFQM